MQLIGIENIVFLCFGAAMVGIYSWSRFDEPSCDTQSEYFARFKPRFSTSYTLYTRAKLGYACAIILLYCILSFVPELFVALAGAGPNAIPSKHVSPLVVALAIVSLQNAPVLRDVECRIRGFLHAFARIPECVRRTVACMRSSPFNFNRRRGRGADPQAQSAGDQQYAIPGRSHQPAERRRSAAWLVQRRMRALRAL